MNNRNYNPQSENSVSPEIYAARIGLIGTLLSTLGDGLQSIGAGIALQQLEISSIQDAQTQADQSNQFDSMQKQIDLLTKKIEEMEKRNKIKYFYKKPVLNQLLLTEERVLTS